MDPLGASGGAIRIMASFSITPPLGRQQSLHASVRVAGETVARHAVDGDKQVVGHDGTAALPGVFGFEFAFELEQVLCVSIVPKNGECEARVAMLLEERSSVMRAPGGYSVRVTLEEENREWNVDAAGTLDPVRMMGNPFEALDMAIEMAPQEELTVAENVTLQVRAEHLPKIGVLPLDPFFQLRRSVEGVAEKQWPAVAASEVVPHSRDPAWSPLRISLSELANNDRARTILFEVFDKRKIGAAHLLGSFQSSVDALLAANGAAMALRAADGKANDARVFVTVSLTRTEQVAPSARRQALTALRGRLAAQLQQRHTYPMLYNPFSFVNYLQHGLRIRVTVGVDFTGSNGHPLDPGSLHAADESNQYSAAIRSIGAILAPYAVPQWGAYGFGGALGNYTGAHVSHCFQLNMETEAVDGVAGVLAAYKSALETWSLAGPTHFASVLETVERMIDARDSHYHVLVILTDGVLDDMPATTEAICRLSFKPFSLIIVGVGQGADWKKMSDLDSDDHPLVAPSSGAKAVRDCVQFVSFEEFRSSPKDLSAAVLAEVPRQVCEWAALVRCVPMQFSAPPP